MVDIPENLQKKFKEDTISFLKLPIDNYFYLHQELNKWPIPVSLETFPEQVFRFNIVAEHLQLNEEQKKLFIEYEIKQFISREKYLFDIGYARPPENLLREGWIINEPNGKVKIVNKKTGKELTSGQGEILFDHVSGIFWDMTNRLAWLSKECIENSDQPWAIKYYLMQIVAGFTTIESYINTCAKDYIDSLPVNTEVSEIFADEFNDNVKGKPKWINIVGKLKKWPKYISKRSDDWDRNNITWTNFLTLKNLRDDIIHSKKQADEFNSIKIKELVFVSETVRNLCTVIGNYIDGFEPEWLNRYRTPLKYE